MLPSFALLSTVAIATAIATAYIESAFQSRILGVSAKGRKLKIKRFNEVCLWRCSLRFFTLVLAPLVFLSFLSLSLSLYVYCSLIMCRLLALA